MMAAVRRRLPAADARVLGALGVVLLAVLAATWRRWGAPEIDPGLDLTTASGYFHGRLPYEDIRYIYGPAGLTLLAGSFELFGASLSTAWGLGIVETVAILGVFYALARVWLPAITAGAATLVLIPIAFSGTVFDFVLPHSSAATMGCLALLAEVLALAKGRRRLGGVFAGICVLTRPEFVIFAAAAGLGTGLGRAREDGRSAGVRALLEVALPGLLVSVPVLAFFAARAGLHELIFENLIPVDFARVAGDRIQGQWAPVSVAGLVGILARGAIWALGLAGLVRSVLEVGRRRGPARALGLWPLAAAGAAVLFAYAASKGLGLFPGTRGVLVDESKRLLIAMSWLPLPAIAVAVWALRRAWRGDAAPGVGWAPDLTLALTAAACGIRCYHRFTPDSYAPYFAALPLLVAAIVHERVGDRWPQARWAARGALVVIAGALMLHAYAGLYRDDTTLVRTPRGSFKASQPTASSLQGTVDFVTAHSRPGEQVLVVPDDSAVHFLTDRDPPLYDVSFLPGRLDTKADERDAIARLDRAPPCLVVLAARSFDNFGLPRFGVDYNRLLGGWISRSYRTAATYGDVAHPPRDSQPTEAYSVLERRGRACVDSRDR
jgi:hypothetical protein